MWLFSETGFVSAVEDRNNSKMFIVRGRDSRSLEPLAALAGTEIIESPHADYPFRVRVSRARFGEWVAEQIGNLSYDNYKGRMHEKRPEFLYALHEVWEIMHDVSYADRESWEQMMSSRDSDWEDLDAEVSR